MTLTKILIWVAFYALILTLIVGFGFKKHRNWFMTYVQNYCGAFFLFSGWVKAVDPMGLAFKMADYFAAFETTFSETWMSFICPIFPALSSIKFGFATSMIVFELILGVMLIIGSRSKFTIWSFGILVAFFTVLTGYTYLTGYVPSGTNFFSFSDWGAFKDSNMQVTDCGCFGDYLKLKPFTSFMKDVVLLFPAFYFLFRHKDMHQLFTPNIRLGLGISTLLISLVLCLSNYVWDIPNRDFRPFKKGVNVAETKEAELGAIAAIPIIAYELKSKATGEVTTIPYNQYIKDFKKYPKEDYEFEQVLGESTLEPTKISEYSISDIDGVEITGDLLHNEKPSVMFVSYIVKGNGKKALRTVKDTLMSLDTIQTTTGTSKIEQTIDKIVLREEEYLDYVWDPDFFSDYADVIRPFAEAAQADGFHVYAVAGGADKNMLDQLKHDAGLNFEFYTADDILLKTIVRSNPGTVLWKNGVILDKWHVDKLPDYEAVKSGHNLK